MEDRKVDKGDILLSEASSGVSVNADLRLGHWKTAAMVFLVPVIIFFVFRINIFPLTNNDARFTFYDYQHKIDANIFSVFEDDPRYHQNQYRPLSVLLWANIADLYWMYGEKYHWLVVLSMACLNGLLSLAIYGICFNYCKNKLASIFASLLYTFSLAGICSTWHNLFTAFQLAPLILIAGAIFAYQKFRSLTSQWRWYWLGMLIFCCLIAPWFREISYIPAIVIFVLELLRLMRKRSLFFLVPGVLTAHALIPKAIPALLGLYDGPIKPLGTEGAAASGSTSIANIHHNVSGFIVNEIPPSLWLLVIIPAIAYSTVILLPNLLRKSYWMQQFVPLKMIELDQTGHCEKKRSFFVKVTGICIGTAIAAGMLLLIHPVFRVNLGMTENTERVLPTFFLLALAVFAGFRFGALFPLWFGLGASLPWLFGSTQELHNGFSMSALAIIGALFCRELLIALGKLRIIAIRWLLISVVVLVLVLAGVDQLANVPTSYLNLHNINLVHQKAASWLLENTPKGTSLIADTYAGDEIGYRASYPSDKYTFCDILPYGLYNTPTSLEWHLEVIRISQAANCRVFYIHLRNGFSDPVMLHPVKLLQERVVFDLDVFSFALDPLRFAADSRKYPRRSIHGEWDGAYGWVGYGYGTNPCIWSAEIVVYELLTEKIAELESLSFVYLQPRWTLMPWGWAPRRALDDTTATDFGWINNTDTEIVPYEKFKSGRPGNITRAVNRTGFGIANTIPFSVTAGKQYDVVFNITKKSGTYPTFRISEDPYGNTSLVIYTTVDGKMNYVFEAPATGSYYAVFRVEDGEKTDFSVRSFYIRENTGAKAPGGSLVAGSYRDSLPFWSNNTDTNIDSYEEFSFVYRDNIIRAVNTAGIGITNTGSISMIDGRRYEITFDMVKASGVHPTFRISQDPDGNTSLMVRKTRDGIGDYVFYAPKTMTCYAVFKVEDGEETDFSVEGFSLQEVLVKSNKEGHLVSYFEKEE